MKIAMVTPTFPPYQGGIGNVARALAGKLQTRGHQVTVFTPDYGLHDGVATSLDVRRLRSLIHYGNAAFLPHLFGLLRGFDVVHLHYPFFGGCEATALAASFRGQPLVLHYHHDALGIGFRRAAFAAHRAFFLRPMVAAASKVVVTSIDYAYQSQLAKAIKAAPAKFMAIPNGVDTQHFCPGQYPQALAEQLGVAGSKVVLFVGSLDSAHYFKGVNYLIQAFSQLEDKSTKLVIVGDGDLRYTYQELVASFGLEDRVRFCPEVSYQQLPDYYRLASCLVLPSIDKTEAFGVVLIEAMASGTPVVASDLPGVRSVVGHQAQHGLLAKPKDVSHLAKQIARLLTDDALAEACRTVAVDAARERYDWGVIAAEFEGVYRQAVEAKQ